MKYITLLVVILFISIVEISCAGETPAVITDKTKLIKKLKKTDFDWKEPLTIFRKVDYDPICLCVPPALKEICRLVKDKLKRAKFSIQSLQEDKFSFRGCFEFQVHGTNKKQLVKRCPFSINNEFSFISHGYEMSNSYYVYEGKDLQKGASIDLIAQIPVGKYVIFLVEMFKSFTSKKE